MSSRVASTLGWQRPARLSLIQAICRMPEGTPENVSRVWFEPDETPYFFWLVPESPTRGAVGLISEDGRTARTVLDAFLARQRFEPLTYQAARIPGYDRWIPPHRKVGNSDVYLVGDAAGHVKVTTVGGIVNGFRGAQAVATAITDGHSSRHFRPLRRELDTHLFIRRALHGLTTREYETLLMLFNEALKRRAGATTRDRPERLLLQSLLAQPRLVGFGAQALLRSTFRGRRGRKAPLPEEGPITTTNPRPSWALLTGRTAKEELESAR
jgi:flavin-dependent dehydrogenase